MERPKVIPLGGQFSDDPPVWIPLPQAMNHRIIVRVDGMDLFNVSVEMLLLKSIVHGSQPETVLELTQVKRQ